MKNVQTLLIFCLVLLTFSLSSCQAIADIFKTGFWAGIIVVVLVVAILAFIVRKMRG